MSEICPIAREQQVVEIKIDKRRYGKTMTIIEGINEKTTDMKSLVSKLKSICASGGTVKDGKIELQGDHREKVKKYLEELGYTVKMS